MVIALQYQADYLECVSRCDFYFDRPPRLPDVILSYHHHRGTHDLVSSDNPSDSRPETPVFIVSALRSSFFTARPTIGTLPGKDPYSF